MGLNFTLIDENGEVDEYDQYPRFDFHITHNLGKMADKLKVYDCLWRPEENGFNIAAHITPYIQRAIYRIELDPSVYDKYDAVNGWGTCSQFVLWLKDLLKTCLEHPDWTILVSV